jgi:hypothetical protein
MRDTQLLLGRRRFSSCGRLSMRDPREDLEWTQKPAQLEVLCSHMWGEGKGGPTPV